MTDSVGQFLKKLNFVWIVLQLTFKAFEGRLRKTFLQKTDH